MNLHSALLPSAIKDGQCLALEACAETEVAGPIGSAFAARRRCKAEVIWLGFTDELSFFPTCQVRVVRFYQNCSPPRLAVLLLLLVLLLLQFLLDHVCINFHLHFRLANSSPSSLPTLFAKLFATSQLSVHRWTSTWDLPSSVCTAGPQPGTCPAQCAPLHLNRGPSQLSVHRWTSTWDLPSSLDLNRGPSQLSVYHWTSTWDLPSSVCTAGPQRPDRMPEDKPDRMSDRMPEDMPDKMP